MKKVLIILGSIFLGIIVLGAIGIGYAIVRGTTLDRESKAFAKKAIPAIITNWNEEALLSQASPQFLKKDNKETIDRFFRLFRTLGPLKKYDPPTGDALMSATTKYGKMISASYSTTATFKNGKALVIMVLIKQGNKWEILAFNVKSPEFLPK